MQTFLEQILQNSCCSSFLFPAMVASFSFFLPCLAICVFASQEALLQPPKSDGYDFHTYLAHFGKVYAGEELARRHGIFEEALQTVIRHNEEYEMGRHTWWMAPNKLMDLTREEFRQLCSAYTRLHVGQAVNSPLQSSANPDQVDWRSKQVVTPVYDQGSCGACWAFSASEALESHLAIATGKLLQLSPQGLVSCVKNPQECGGRGGCSGATLELAFNYSKTSGIPLLSDVPYIKRKGTCKSYQSVVMNDGYVKLPVNDAGALESAIANVGPISVIVAALPWQLYGGGIFHGCSSPLPSLGNELNHAVQVVGYGTEGRTGYWLVRNSWGSWGEKGYIRVSRSNDAKTFIDDDPKDGVACKPYPKTQTVGGECGILFDATYPTGVKFVSVGPLYV